jgi:hypothetical protein
MACMIRARFPVREHHNEIEHAHLLKREFAGEIEDVAAAPSEELPLVAVGGLLGFAREDFP